MAVFLPQVAMQASSVRCALMQWDRQRRRRCNVGTGAGGTGGCTMLLFSFWRLVWVLGTGLLLVAQGAAAFCVGKSHSCVVASGRSQRQVHYTRPTGRGAGITMRLPGDVRPSRGRSSEPWWPLAMSARDMDQLQRGSGLVGEDSAYFSMEEQTLQAWGSFLAVLGTVLTALYFLWINPDTGFGDDFVRVLEDVSGGDTSITAVLILGIFAVAHSGLASLRPKGEELIGARAWRVLFGVVSLPLALSAVVYFINHRYDGIHLWDIKTVPGVHDLLWITNFLSFFFLYPSTFNLLEVAAVDKPKLHLWETGIIRITRHPQFVGQAMWCGAHLAWIGTSFTAVVSSMLMAHHAFAIWNGDRRLRDKHGEAFEAVKERTSFVPFQAIIEGRQQLPEDYASEFARGPYLLITVLTIGAYFAHPFMQAGSWSLQW